MGALRTPHTAPRPLNELLKPQEGADPFQGHPPHRHGLWWREAAEERAARAAALHRLVPGHWASGPRLAPGRLPRAQLPERRGVPALVRAAPGAGGRAAGLRRGERPAAHRRGRLPPPRAAPRRTLPGALQPCETALYPEVPQEQGAERILKDLKGLQKGRARC